MSGAVGNRRLYHDWSQPNAESSAGPMAPALEALDLGPESAVALRASSLPPVDE